MRGASHWRRSAARPRACSVLRRSRSESPPSKPPASGSASASGARSDEVVRNPAALEDIGAGLESSNRVGPADARRRASASNPKSDKPSLAASTCQPGSRFGDTWSSTRSVPTFLIRRIRFLGLGGHTNSLQSRRAKSATSDVGLPGRSSRGAKPPAVRFRESTRCTRWSGALPGRGVPGPRRPAHNAGRCGSSPGRCSPRRTGRRPSPASIRALRCG